ncbi:3-methyladenine DNA glycosylase [soil metagenome]
MPELAVGWARPDGLPAAAAPDTDVHLRLDFKVDLWLTLAPLRHGRGDPTIRFDSRGAWRTTRTVAGAATLRLEPLGTELRVRAWGPGAERAVAAVPRLVGAEDDPSLLRLPRGPLRELAARFADLRFGRTDAVMESLVPAIIEQKVIGAMAQRSYRLLVERYGEDAPGPAGLRLPPRPETLARVPYHALHPLGLEQRRALTLARASSRAAWLESASTMTAESAGARLRSFPGVGAWTAAETVRTAFGDPDAVSAGDFHTPNLVAWALAGEPRADDARMLELLEPFRGQRARLVRLLELSGLRAPRFGPRLAVRSFEHF